MEKQFTTINNILEVYPEMVSCFPLWIIFFTGSGKHFSRTDLHDRGILRIQITLIDYSSFYIDTLLHHTPAPLYMFDQSTGHCQEIAGSDYNGKPYTNTG
jgi:hypothetical protein